MLKRLQSSEGFSLVELLIAVTLIVMVIGVAYSLQSYGMVSFSRGEQLAAIQQNVRLVTRILSEEIRYGQKVEILGSMPESLDPKYVYFLADKGNVVRVKQEVPEVIAENTGKGAGYSLSFTKAVDDPTMVEMIIRGDSGQSKYELTTSVSSLNSDDVGVIGTESGFVLGVKGL